MMTYRQRFGRYDIRIGGMVWKWFVEYEKALAEYERLAKYPDELDGDMELVDVKSGKIIAHIEAED